MKKSINLSKFRDSFKTMNRDDYSYEGYEVLYNFLEEVSEGDYDLDVVGVCCEFSEDEANYFFEQYDVKSIEELSDHTIVLSIPNSSRIIIQDY